MKKRINKKYNSSKLSKKMPNQSGKSETLVIAEKAGIATKFPGIITFCLV